MNNSEFAINKVSLHNQDKSLMLATSLSSSNVMWWNLLCNLKHAVAAPKLEKFLATQFWLFNVKKIREIFNVCFSWLKKKRKSLHLFLIWTILQIRIIFFLSQLWILLLSSPFPFWGATAKNNVLLENYKFFQSIWRRRSQLQLLLMDKDLVLQHFCAQVTWCI